MQAKDEHEAEEGQRTQSEAWSIRESKSTYYSYVWSKHKANIYLQHILAMPIVAT